MIGSSRGSLETPTPQGHSPSLSESRPWLPEVALLFEGGGMRASYTAPVVQRLIEEGIDVGLVAGISAGASHTANYLNRLADRAARSFVDLAGHPNFGNIRTMLRGRGYFNSDFIYHEIGQPDSDMLYDFEAFQNHPSQVGITAFRATDGATVTWGREDMPTLHDLMVRVRASSTVPGLMPLTYIDDEVYVDGALGASGGIPLDVAQAAGKKKFVIVRTRPQDFRKTEFSFPQVVGRALRKYPEVARAVLTRWQRYNATLDEIDALVADGAAWSFVPEVEPVSSREKDVAKLQKCFTAGKAQVDRQWPELLEFLGLR